MANQEEVQSNADYVIVYASKDGGQVAFVAVDNCLIKNSDSQSGKRCDATLFWNDVVALLDLKLETGKNSECQDRGFDEKQAVYQTSCYSMTNSFDYPEWTPTQVNSRQRELARLATSIWRIAQISS